MKAFIEIASDSHFPLQNLPFGIFKPSAAETPRVGVALGDFVIDLSILEKAQLVNAGGEQPVFNRLYLNDFIRQGQVAWRAVRQQLVDLLAEASELRAPHGDILDAALYRQGDVIMCMPVQIGDYTDFYASESHAANVGTMFRDANNPLLPNWKHLPVGYHGRASSVYLSGEPIIRPNGQVLNADGVPEFKASTRLDFELESAFFVGKGTDLGTTVALKDAEDHIFGLVVLNDWSARDIQKWEYVPLGPFLGKSFATTVSPWVVTMDALAPFKTEGPTQDPTPLTYLQQDPKTSHYDIHLDVKLQSAKMREPQRICRSNHKYLYWSIAQQLTHHASNGCNLNVGDLMASGTISGPDQGEFGSMLEIAWAGKEPLALPTGETRCFINDYDTVIMTGYAQGEGYRVGFGEVRNQVIPSRS